MPLKVPDVGLLRFINLIRNNIPDLFVKLFKNDFTPATGTVVADFLEANFSGYAAGFIANDVAGWPGAPLLDAMNHRYQMTASDVSYLGTGAGVTNNIYGYYVVDASNNLWWAERLPGVPFVMGATGSNLTITPTLTDKSEF